MEQNPTPEPTGTSTGTAAGAAPGPEPTQADPAGAHGPRVTWQQVQDTSQISRPHQRMVAGVAAGLARHLDVDPLLVRIGFAVLSFFGGAGLILYGALWALLPEDGQPRAALHLDVRSRRLAILGVGVVACLVTLGNAWSFNWVPWPFVLVALLVWAFWPKDQEQNQPQHQPQGPAQHSAPYPQPGTQQPHDRAQAPDQRQGQQPGQQQGQQQETVAHAPLAHAPLAHGATGEQPWTLPVPPPAPAWTPLPPTAAPPTVQAPAPRPVFVRPPDPRKKGPILFWITVALIALAVGVLGMLDVAGVDVAPSAYPALGLGITAAALLVGSFWGRAGGLIALGLVLGLSTLAVSAQEQWRDDATQLRPVTAAAIPSDQEFRTGHMVLDLGRLADSSDLDGRALTISGGAGMIEVRVPHDVALDVRAAVGGPGAITVLDHELGGIALEHASFESPEGVEPAARMRLDLELGVGRIVVTRHSADTVISSEQETDGASSPARPSISLSPEAGDL